MRRIVPPFGFLILFTLGFTPVALAQKITGDITGTVNDATGGTLPGATISAHCEGTGLTRTTATDAAGGYPLYDTPVIHFTSALHTLGVAERCPRLLW